MNASPRCFTITTGFPKCRLGALLLMIASSRRPRRGIPIRSPIIRQSVRIQPGIHHGPVADEVAILSGCILAAAAHRYHSSTVLN